MNKKQNKKGILDYILYVVLGSAIVVFLSKFIGVENTIVAVIIGAALLIMNSLYKNRLR